MLATTGTVLEYTHLVIKPVRDNWSGKGIIAVNCSRSSYHYKLSLHLQRLRKLFYCLLTPYRWHNGHFLIEMLSFWEIPFERWKKLNFLRALAIEKKAFKCVVCMLKMFACVCKMYASSGIQCNHMACNELKNIICRVVEYILLQILPDNNNAIAELHCDFATAFYIMGHVISTHFWDYSPAILTCCQTPTIFNVFT